MNYPVNRQAGSPPADAPGDWTRRFLLRLAVGLGLGTALIFGRIVIPFTLIDILTAHWRFWATLTLIDHPVAYGSLFVVLVLSILWFCIFITRYILAIREMRHQERRVDDELAAKRAHEKWTVDRNATSAERITFIQHVQARLAEARADVIRNVETVAADRKRASWMLPHERFLAELKLIEAVTKYLYWLQEILRVTQDPGMEARMGEASKALDFVERAKAMKVQQKDGTIDYPDDETRTAGEKLVAAGLKALEQALMQRPVPPAPPFRMPEPPKR